MQVSDRWESNFGSRPIWDVCLEPGSQRRVVFGCGSTLYLVNSANGEIESKYPNFHTDEIFTVGWTKDQDDKDVIASGAKDKHVIIWDLENDKAGFHSTNFEFIFTGGQHESPREFEFTFFLEHFILRGRRFYSAPCGTRTN